MKATLSNKQTKENTQRRLPRSLVGAAGMLRGKLPDGVVYQQTIRKEWAKRNVSYSETCLA